MKNWINKTNRVEKNIPIAEQTCQMPVDVWKESISWMLVVLLICVHVL